MRGTMGDAGAAVTDVAATKTAIAAVKVERIEKYMAEFDFKRSCVVWLGRKTKERRLFYTCKN